MSIHCTDYCTLQLKGNLSLLVQGFWYSAWSNTCLYSICETYPSYWGYLLAVNLQIYLGTLSLNHANNVPKLPGVNCVAKIWALAVMLKALPLVHFWSVLLLKEQLMTSFRKMLKKLVWSVQNQSISRKMCLENNHRIRRFFTDCFSVKFAPKIPAKLADSSGNSSLKIPRNLTFFPEPIRSPASRWASQGL